MAKNVYGGEPEWINNNPFFSEFTVERREGLQFTIPNHFFLFFVSNFPFTNQAEGGGSCGTPPSTCRQCVCMFTLYRRFIIFLEFSLVERSYSLKEDGAKAKSWCFEAARSRKKAQREYAAGAVVVVNSRRRIQLFASLCAYASGGDVAVSVFGSDARLDAHGFVK